MAVSKRLRFEVLRRDNHTCRYCGRTAPEVKLTIDHVLPAALGGKDESANLVTACEPCNSGKSSAAPSATVVDDVAQDAVRWAHAQKVAAQRMLDDLRERETVQDCFREHWDGWKVAGKPVPLPGDWKDSITNFTLSGLPFQVLLDCLERAMRASKVQPENVFRYMCGVAWNRVGELQQATKALLGEGTGDGEEEEEDRDDEVVTWEFVGEQLLKRLPVWMHEMAERLAEDDWRHAGEPHPPRSELLPHVVRHIGTVIRDCEIEYKRVEVGF